MSKKKQDKAKEEVVVKEEAKKEIKNEVKKETKNEVKKENKKETKKENKKVNSNNAKNENVPKNIVTEKSLQKKLKKVNSERTIILSIVIGVLVIAFAIFGIYYYQSNEKAIATFDGGKVTIADYTVYYKTFAPLLEYYGYPSSIIPEQIANKAGIDMIIMKKAKEANVTLSDEDKASVDEIFNDKDQVQQFIDEGIDVARMKQLYYNDYTISAYIEKLKDEIADEEVIEYIKSVSGEDADLYEYNTSHILFKTVDDSYNSLSDEEKANVRAKAESVLARALSGEDFASLAKEFSEDTGTSEDGGKFTMYMDGNVYTEYADAVKNLAEGQITATLVETQAGYHIIKLDSKVENGRAHNDTEREECVDEQINGLTETMHFEINEEAMNNAVYAITGVKVEEEEEEEDDDYYQEEESTDTTSTDTTDGDSTSTTE